MAYVPKIDSVIEAHDDGNAHSLTCGVEMEFLVPSVAFNSPDPDPDMGDQQLYKSIGYASVYIYQEVREQLLESLQKLEEIPFRNVSDDYFHPPHDKVIVYDSWRLGGENTISKHGGIGLPQGPYHWTDCELTSMVMEEDEYAQQIKDVCRMLKTTRIHLNKSTAVHVHVGLGDEPFSLLTVKKFVTLYWLTENIILGLQHPSRHDNVYGFRLTKHSQLAVRSKASLDADFGEPDNNGLEMMRLYLPELKHLGPARLRNQISRIWGSTSVVNIARLMQGAKERISTARIREERGSVGFTRFQPIDGVGGNIQTFEWRQMQGSVDADHINRWIKFCMAFTDFCRLSEKNDFMAFVKNVVDKGTAYTGIDLVKDLGVDADIFETMARKWAENSQFCADNEGKALFEPKS